MRRVARLDRRVPAPDTAQRQLRAKRQHGRDTDKDDDDIAADTADMDDTVVALLHVPHRAARNKLRYWGADSSGTGCCTEILEAC